MTEIINLAINERNLIAWDIRRIAYELAHPDEDFPISERTRQQLLLRMSVLDNGVTYLENMIIAELCGIPLTDFLTTKAKENE